MPRGAPTIVSPVVGMVVVLVVMLAANDPGQCETVSSYEDEDYEDGCHPEEADVCFKDVNDNLMCNLGKAGGRNCTNRNAHDLCESMEDALDCCEDIMNTCSESDGLDTFYVWLTGLRGVYSHLCVEDFQLGLITDLLQGSNCFRLKRFISCVEERAGLTHVADLLTTELNLHECNQLQVSVAGCIELSEKNRAKCRGKADAVNEALIVFFSDTACGQHPTPYTPPPLPCVPYTEEATTVEQINNNNNNSSSTSHENNNRNNKNNRSKVNTRSTTTTINTTRNSNNNDNNIKENTSSSTPPTTPNSSSTNTTPTTITKTLACQQTQNNLVNSGTSTASTVVLTVVVTMVVVVLAALVLVKRGVLTIRTDFDRRLMGMNDQDTNSAYDRF